MNDFPSDWECEEQSGEMDEPTELLSFSQDSRDHVDTAVSVANFVDEG